MRLAMAISPSRESSSHRAHFAQIHADRVVGAIGRLFLGRSSGARTAVIQWVDLVLARGRFGLLVALVVVVLGRLLILDDVDTHLVDRGHDVLDLLADIWSCGSASLISS